MRKSTAIDLLALCTLISILTSTVVCAKTYSVEANASAVGSDGSDAKPFKTIGEAIAAAKAGDLILVRPGTYVESVIFKTGGTKEAPLVLQATKRHGVIVTGADMLLGGASSAGFITIRGFMFRNSRKDIWKIAAQARSGWRIEDCIFIGGGLDARLDDNAAVHAQDVTFLRVICEETWGNGMTAQGVDNFLIKDCVLRRCNRSGERVADCTGGSKLFNTDRCLTALKRSHRK